MHCTVNGRPPFPVCINQRIVSLDRSVPVHRDAGRDRAATHAAGGPDLRAPCRRPLCPIPTRAGRRCPCAIAPAAALSPARRRRHGHSAARHSRRRRAAVRRPPAETGRRHAPRRPSALPPRHARSRGVPAGRIRAAIAPAPGQAWGAAAATAAAAPPAGTAPTHPTAPRADRPPPAPARRTAWPAGRGRSPAPSGSSR